jgi:GTPase
MANIHVKINPVEMMIYFWETIAERGKVNEQYIIGVANEEDMEALYDEEFTKDSFRKVLSAISNRELVNNATKKESRFWSLNMWMLEDIENMRKMVATVKTLNLDHLKDKISKDLTIVFIPATTEETIVDGDKLLINFFKIAISPFEEGKITIAGEEFNKYIEEKVLAL